MPFPYGTKDKPTFENPTVSVVLAVGCFALGWYLFHDAWDGRGIDQPKWFRPFSWW